MISDSSICKGGFNLNTTPTLVDPSVELILDDDPFKKIEIAGRTCYKSESKITDESSRKFVNNLIRDQHTAMVEHAFLVFQLEYDEDTPENIVYDYLELVNSNSWVEITVEPDLNRILISSNIRAICNRGTASDPYILNDPIYRATIEKYPEFKLDLPPSEAIYTQLNAKIVDIQSIHNLTPDEFKKHFRITAKFITDRGVTHELVRHRTFSFAQESTRYCNYSKDKFGNKVTFCKPSTYDDWTDVAKEIFHWSLLQAEASYFRLLDEGELTPELARAVLPNALKTEIIVSGPIYEWTHFFNLRSRGLTGPPHPDIQHVANMCLMKIYDYVESLNYYNDFFI